MGKVLQFKRNDNPDLDGTPCGRALKLIIDHCDTELRYTLIEDDADDPYYSVSADIMVRGVPEPTSIVLFTIMEMGDVDIGVPSVFVDAMIQNEVNDPDFDIWDEIRSFVLGEAIRTLGTVGANLFTFVGELLSVPHIMWFGRESTDAFFMHQNRKFGISFRSTGLQLFALSIPHEIPRYTAYCDDSWLRFERQFQEIFKVSFREYLNKGDGQRLVSLAFVQVESVHGLSAVNGAGLEKSLNCGGTDRVMRMLISLLQLAGQYCMLYDSEFFAGCMVDTDWLGDRDTSLVFTVFPTSHPVVPYILDIQVLSGEQDD